MNVYDRYHSVIQTLHSVYLFWTSLKLITRDAKEPAMVYDFTLFVSGF